MRERVGPSTNWADDYPTTCGGKRHWKVMMERPAERLQQLLTIHGIAAHNCPICDNLHGLWPAQLTGPSHYSTLYHRNDLENSPLRWQWWDLPTSSFPTSLVGRQGPQLCCSELQTLFNLPVSVVVPIILVVLEISATEIDEPKGSKRKLSSDRTNPSLTLWATLSSAALLQAALLWVTLLWTILSYSSVSYFALNFSELLFCKLLWANLLRGAPPWTTLPSLDPSCYFSILFLSNIANIAMSFNLHKPEDSTSFDYKRYESDFFLDFLGNILYSCCYQMFDVYDMRLYLHKETNLLHNMLIYANDVWLPGARFACSPCPNIHFARCHCQVSGCSSIILQVSSWWFVVNDAIWLDW